MIVTWHHLGDLPYKIIITNVANTCKCTNATLQQRLHASGYTGCCTSVIGITRGPSRGYSAHHTYTHTHILT